MACFSLGQRDFFVQDLCVVCVCVWWSLNRRSQILTCHIYDFVSCRPPHISHEFHSKIPRQINRQSPRLRASPES